MLSDEEKKAIDDFQLQIEEDKKELPYSEETLKYKQTILNLIQKQDTEINKLNNAIQNIREEFLKYNWENSTKEQICNQLKSLYESIFMKEDK